MLLAPTLPPNCLPPEATSPILKPATKAALAYPAALIAPDVAKTAPGPPEAAVAEALAAATSVADIICKTSIAL